MTERDYGKTVVFGEVTVEQLQHKMLEIFRYFQSVCKENGLRYWAGGGTLIGAVRHHGFIPWDDDIDVFMPRGDYEKLWEIWPQIGDHDRYALCRSDENTNIRQADMQLADIHTTFINRHSADLDICHGVSIDVMPFDGCPENPLARLAQIWHAVMFGIFNVQRLPDHQGKLLRTATSVVLSLVRSPQRRYRIWKRHEKAMSRYDFDSSATVKELMTSFRALFWPHPRRDFETVEMDFAGLSMPVPAGYDRYLKRLFGDYMSYPAEDERCPKHDVVLIDLNNSYLSYRGKYYLSEGNK